MNHVWNAENLFHYKAEQTKYSIKPEDYGNGKLPFFLKDKETNTYLNEFFFFVFSKVGDWQCLKELAVGSSEETESRRHRERRQRGTGPGSLGRGPHGFGSATGLRPCSRLACDVCIKNTVHKFLECSAIGYSSCSIQSGAVGASMWSSAVTVASISQSMVYTMLYTMIPRWYIPAYIPCNERRYIPVYIPWYIASYKPRYIP